MGDLSGIQPRAERLTPGCGGTADPEVLSFLGARCVAGVEEMEGPTYRRSLSLPHGTGVAELSAHDGDVSCTLWLDDARDRDDAVRRCRSQLDLDTDVEAVAEHLGNDPHLAPLVRSVPGRRVPGTTDPFELAVRAVLGQQVSVAGARTLAGRLVAARGEPLTAPVGGVTHAFPSPQALADADLAEIGMPRTRRAALRALATEVAEGRLVLERDAARTAASGLQSLPGIGPWTAGYVAMRALGDPDVFLASDFGIRKAAAALGLPERPRALEEHALRWRPWRSYAVVHLWSSVSG